MRKLLATTALGVATATMALGAVTPAEAQRWGGGWHGGDRYYGGGGYRGYRGGWGRGGNGAAVAAGIIGLGVGAAIASNRGYGYGGYGAPYGYGYGYAPPPGYGYYGGYCQSDWQWDGYRGRYVRVQYCD